jgi:hypothetical protein
MSNWHLHFPLKCHFNVTCLVTRVIIISNVSIDACFFHHKSHYMSNSILWVSINMHFCVCKLLHVKCEFVLVKIHIYLVLEWHGIVHIALFPTLRIVLFMGLCEHGWWGLVLAPSTPLVEKCLCQEYKHSSLNMILITHLIVYLVELVMLWCKYICNNL